MTAARHDHAAPPARVSLRSAPPLPEAGADPTLTLAGKPDWLTELGAAAWDAYAPLLHPQPYEQAAFAAYCEAIAQFEEATGIIAEAGIVVAGPVGDVLPSPMLSVRAAADGRIAFWMTRFPPRS